MLRGMQVAGCSQTCVHTWLTTHTCISISAGVCAWVRACVRACVLCLCQVNTYEQAAVRSLTCHSLRELELMYPVSTTGHSKIEYKPTPVYTTSAPNQGGDGGVGGHLPPCCTMRSE